MNKFIFTYLLLILTVSLFSQPKKPYNKFSIETTFGYSAPLRNKSLNDNGHFASFPHIDFGLRYMFNKNWGAKAAINYDAFKEGDKGTFQYRLNIEAYYNLGKLINLKNQKVALYSHLGSGLAYNKSMINDVTIGIEKGLERQIDLTYGFSPRFKLNDRISLLADATYILVLKQHFYYSGEPNLSAGNSGGTASHLTFGLGISISIGNNDDPVNLSK